MLYRMAIRLGARRFAPEAPFPWQHVLRMDLALVIFYLAVGSPLDEAGDRFLFSAHMVQHSILIFFLPPLILAAFPSYVFKPLTEHPATRSLFAFLVHPVVALLTFNLVFATWHIPWLYEYALRDRAVHELEHIMFLVTAIQAWWPISSPSKDFPRLAPGPRILYLFLMSVSQIPLFAFLVMLGEQYYPTYAAAPRIISYISPLEDQAIGGIIMKVLGEIIFGFYLLLAFIEWYRGERGPAPGSAAGEAVTSA
jgi:putative membrane protein